MPKTSRRSSRRKSPKPLPRGILSLSSQGYGFVQTAEGEFFIPASKVNFASDGDHVEVRRIRDDRKAQAPGHTRVPGQVVRILQRAQEDIVGVYEWASPFGVVVPLDTRINFDIFTQDKPELGLKDGDIVKVRMINFPSKYEAATGEIIERVGTLNEPGLDIDLIVSRYKFEEHFSEQVLKEARAAKLNPEGALLEGYRDITDRLIVTIDPNDAKDFDDALSLARTHNGFRLGVHIADVSHYVPWNSALDLAARRRAVSVYLVDRVIPMLPEELSCDLCSLRPQEVRRSLTVDLYLDEQGHLQQYDFYPALIKSHRRLTYAQAQERLNACYQDFSMKSFDLTRTGTTEDDLLCGLHWVAQRLDAQRAEAGSLDFETQELRMVLNDEGEPIDISLRKKTNATNLVEQAMILANTAAARFLQQRSMPGLFRVHDAPPFDALAGLLPILQEFSRYDHINKDAFLAGDHTALQEVLRLCIGRPEQELIQNLVLRAQSRAVYRAVCESHYGLSLDDYAHFTSPIRRYPDLVVHRMIKQALFGKEESFSAQESALPWIAEHCSACEVQADKASRETQHYKLVEYMQAFIGQHFNALVVGVHQRGLFVQLENGAEGLVSIRSLGSEYFAFDPVRYTLTGTDSGIQYRLGERVRVSLVAARLPEALLDFVLVEDTENDTALEKRVRKGTAQNLRSSSSSHKKSQDRRKPASKTQHKHQKQAKRPGEFSGSGYQSSKTRKKSQGEGAPLSANRPKSPGASRGHRKKAQKPKGAPHKQRRL